MRTADDLDLPEPSVEIYTFYATNKLKNIIMLGTNLNYHSENVGNMFFLHPPVRLLQSSNQICHRSAVTTLQSEYLFNLLLKTSWHTCQSMYRHNLRIVQHLRTVVPLCKIMFNMKILCLVPTDFICEECYGSQKQAAIISVCRINSRVFIT
jgi:hypothetical protein